MKPRVIFGIVAIAIFTSLLFYNFANSISTYTDFEEATGRTSKNIHVVGKWASEQPSGFSVETKSFSFFMTDEKGNTRRVVYGSAKPSNFEQADQMVVIGEMRNDIFYAHDMLLKCPSKYNDGREAEFERPMPG
jgi:cytochrome c-type biogenesis protein CcmE